MLTVETPAQMTNQVLAAGKALLLIRSKDCNASDFVENRLKLVGGANSSLVVAVSDREQVPDLARALNVEKSPTVVFFRRGQRISTLEGRVSGRDMQQVVDSVFW